MWPEPNPSIFIIAPPSPRCWVCIWTSVAGLCREWKNIINTWIRSPFEPASFKLCDLAPGRDLIAHETEATTLSRVAAIFLSLSQCYYRGLSSLSEKKKEPWWRYLKSKCSHTHEHRLPFENQDFLALSQVKGETNRFRLPANQPEV